MNHDAGYSDHESIKASLDDNGDTTHGRGGHWQQQQLRHVRGGIFWRDLGPGSCSSSDYYQLANKFLDVLRHFEYNNIYWFSGLIQFWVPKEVGGCRLHLTTRDQPFAIFERLLKKDQLCEYRKHCMGYDYYVGDLHDKESWGPIGRVFTSGIPETSPDVRLYSDKEHPLRDFAPRCKNYRRVDYGFIPVFDHPNGNKPVAVLEYVADSFYYILFLGEVKKALEKSSSDLRIDVIPSNNLPRKQHYYDADFAFREVLEFAIASVPELHLVQLWVGNNFTYMESLYFWAVGSRDDNSCMYVDYRMEEFVGACQLHRADSNIWNIGQPLLPANSSFFCRNISDLSILVYPLAHYAQRASLSFCFAVCLRNREDENQTHVVEFFLQLETRQDKNPFPIMKFLLEIIDSKLEGYELSSGQSIASMEMPVEISTKRNVLITPGLLSQYAQSTCRPNSKEQMVISRMVKWNVPTSIFTIRKECLHDYKLEMFLYYLDKEKDGKKRKRGHFIFSSLETGSLLESPSHEHSLVSPIDEIHHKIKFLLSKIATELDYYGDYRGYIIQFWAVKKCDDKLHLVTKEHPFVIGNPTKGLWEYRKKSMDHEYLLNEWAKEGPPGRVFRSNYPEYNINLHMYTGKEFPLRDYAVQCGMRSYMAFPVMLPNQNECVGVLEYICFGDMYQLDMYDLPNIMETSFKEANIKAIHTSYPSWNNYAIDRKFVVDEVNVMIHLAQNILHVRDVRLWIKCEQCDNEKCVQLVEKQSHLYMSHKEITKTGIIGTLLAAESKSCFFPNICDFNISEEQGILEARRSRMSACFAICLQSSYTGGALYFLEFFLDQSCRRGENFHKFLRYLLPIMDETLKSFKVASGKKFGEELVVEIITFGNNISEFGSLEPQEPNIPPIRFRISKYGEEINGEQCNDQVVHDDFNSTADCVECEQDKDSSMPLHDDAAIHSKKPGRQNKNGSFNITIEDLEPHFGKKLDDVEIELGVSRSTIKRVCRENGIPRWPSNPRNRGNISLFHTPKSNEDVGTSKAQDLEGSRNKNPPSTRTDFHNCHPRTNAPLHQPILGTNTGECSRSCTKLTEDDVVIIKVTSKVHTVMIKINISAKLEVLKQKVARTLGIDGSFNLKYKDEQSNWISLLSDEGLKIGMEQMSRALEKHKLQLKRKRDVVPPPSLIVRVEELEKDNQSSKDYHLKKKEVSKDSFILVEDSNDGERDYAVDSNNEQEKISDYCGRRDYGGRNHLDAMDQQLIDSFIDGNFTGGEHIWSRGVLAVRSSSLIHLLFGNVICGDVISSYLHILCSAEYRSRNAIFNQIAYLSTYTTANILSLVKRDTRTMGIDGYKRLINKMIRPFGDEVYGLRDHIESGRRYIVVPINDEKCCHWYMLVVDLLNRQIYEYNSMQGVGSADAQHCVVTFLTGWLKCLGKEMNNHVVKVRCRQQDIGSMDCGVFISLWSECLLRDSLEFWGEEPYTDIKWYRARMACTILKDTHCTLPLAPTSKY